MARYYYHGWTEEEEKKLAEIMLSGPKRRAKIDELFDEASKELDRTKASCMNRWYEIRGRFLPEMSKNKAV